MRAILKSNRKETLFSLVLSRLVKPNFSKANILVRITFLKHQKASK